MMKRRFGRATAVLAALAISGCDSPTGGGGGGGTILPITFTVTFDSAGGSEVTAQSVVEGTPATRPDNVSRAFTPAPGLYAGTLDTKYTLAEWRHNDAAWDFTTPVTANITLTAHWTAPTQTPIADVDPHDLAAVMVHVNATANSGAFTLAIGEEVVTRNHRLFNSNGVELTIVGVGGRRDIVFNADCDECSLFFVGHWEATTLESDSRLILGNNITLRGGQGANVYFSLILVSRTGHLIMEAGSEITGHTNHGAVDVWSGHGAAVHIEANAAFTMRGGYIRGNRASGTGTNLAGGVFVQNATSVFTMTGGSISGNFRGTGSDEVPADVFVSATVEDFTVSGNATIDRITLDRIRLSNPTRDYHAFITVGANWTGSINRLDLLGTGSVQDTISWQWTGDSILQAAQGITLTNAHVNNINSKYVIGGTEDGARDFASLNREIGIRDNAGVVRMGWGYYCGCGYRWCWVDNYCDDDWCPSPDGCQCD